MNTNEIFISLSKKDLFILKLSLNATVHNNNNGTYFMLHILSKTDTFYTYSIFIVTNVLGWFRFEPPTLFF